MAKKTKNKQEKFEVVTKNKIIEWSDKLVGLNSFGFGGTNSSIIIKEKQYRIGNCL